MQEHDFIEAVINSNDRCIPVRFSAVHPVQVENTTQVGTRVDWRLDLGISRADPDQWEWSELDDLIQGSPCLRFRINSQFEVDVSGWFGPTQSRIDNDEPDISLDVDLAWHAVEGPVDSVEALWVDARGTQSLGSLTIRDVISVRAHDVTAVEEGQGTRSQNAGLAMWLHATLMIIACVVVAAAIGAYWLFASQQLWLLLALPVVVLVVEQVFERIVPAKCPECGARLCCRVLSKQPANPLVRETDRRYEPDRSPTYSCANCSFQFPNVRHESEDWH